MSRPTRIFRTFFAETYGSIAEAYVAIAARSSARADACALATRFFDRSIREWEQMRVAGLASPLDAVKLAAMQVTRTAGMQRCERVSRTN